MYVFKKNTESIDNSQKSFFERALSIFNPPPIKYTNNLKIKN